MALFNIVITTCQENSPSLCHFSFNGTYHQHHHHPPPPPHNDHLTGEFPPIPPHCASYHQPTPVLLRLEGVPA